MEPDRTLRGVERNTVVILAILTASAAVIARRADVVLGVVGGGALVGYSYWSLKGGVSALAALAAQGGGAAPETRKNVRRALAKVVLRYALLALLAYVMIARLRLHPWGLLAGASSVVAAVSLEAARLVFRR